MWVIHRDRKQLAWSMMATGLAVLTFCPGIGNWHHCAERNADSPSRETRRGLICIIKRQVVFLLHICERNLKQSFFFWIINPLPWFSPSFFSNEYLCLLAVLLTDCKFTVTSGEEPVRLMAKKLQYSSWKLLNSATIKALKHSSSLSEHIFRFYSLWKKKNLGVCDTCRSRLGIKRHRRDFPTEIAP